MNLPSPKYCDLLINDFPETNKFKDFYKKHYKKIKLIIIYAFYFKRNFEKKYKKNRKKHILIAFEETIQKL